MALGVPPPQGVIIPAADIGFNGDILGQCDGAVKRLHRQQGFLDFRTRAAQRGYINRVKGRVAAGNKVASPQLITCRPARNVKGILPISPS